MALKRLGLAPRYCGGAHSRSKVAAIMLAVVIAIFSLYRMSTITDKRFKIIRDNADSHLRPTKSNDQRKHDHKHDYKREEEERFGWDISTPGKSIIGKYWLKLFLSY